MHRKVHEAGLRSSATMMFGHVETAAERVEHLHQPARPAGRDRRLHGLRLLEHAARRRARGAPVPARSTTPAVYLRVQALSAHLPGQLPATSRPATSPRASSWPRSRCASAATTSAARCSRRTSSPPPAASTSKAPTPSSARSRPPACARCAPQTDPALDDALKAARELSGPGSEPREAGRVQAKGVGGLDRGGTRRDLGEPDLGAGAEVVVGDAEVAVGRKCGTGWSPKLLTVRWVQPPVAPRVATLSGTWRGQHAPWKSAIAMRTRPSLRTATDGRSWLEPEEVSAE